MQALNMKFFNIYKILKVILFLSAFLFAECFAIDTQTLHNKRTITKIKKNYKKPLNKEQYKVNTAKTYKNFAVKKNIPKKTHNIKPKFKHDITQHSPKKLEAANPHSFKGTYFLKLRGGISSPSISTEDTNSQMNFSKNLYVFGLAFGKKLTNLVPYDLTLDVEYLYLEKNQTTDVGNQLVLPKSTWSYQSQALMVNLGAYLTSNNKIKPYFKIGMGSSRNKAYTYTYNNTDSSYSNTYNYYLGKTSTDFAYQIGLGINFFSNKIFDTELEYNYTCLGKAETQSTNYIYDNIDNEATPQPSTAKYVKLKNNVFTLGFRFKL